ncbi:hypothetical protein HAX54_028935 [Datura stramonium]|uniref:Uncharacterized protein n=1 Tax=Datura stramonium TaxID=4076 RepID=A0ABS8V691_DATST|nr:hypothetical protein [Datura stramonium]
MSEAGRVMTSHTCRKFRGVWYEERRENGGWKEGVTTVAGCFQQRGAEEERENMREDEEKERSKGQQGFGGSSGRGGKGENNRLGLMVFWPTGIGSEGGEERGKGQRRLEFLLRE